MDNFFINQLEDANCELTWLQKNGNPFILSALSTKVFAIVKDGTGAIVVKFAKAASAGWEGMDITGLGGGVVKFKIESSITKTLAPGKYYVELIARYPSGTYADGYYDIVDEYDLFQVKKSVVSTLTLP